MGVSVYRASAVVVQRVPPAAVDWFMEWQRGVTAAAEEFAGYRGTDLYPPTDSQREEWVAVIHFDDEKSLRQWLESPVRAHWLEKLRERSGDFELKAMPGGFGPWFADLTRGSGGPPPAWKMATTVLLALYPTVMLLMILTGPHTAPLGLAVSTLIGNVLSVSILQWVLVPLLGWVLGGWLKGNERKDRAQSVGVFCLLLLALTTLVLVFRQVTG